MTRTILFLHSGGDWIRGSETVLLDQFTRMDRTRYRPVLICDQEVMAEESRRRGVPARVLPFPEIMWEGRSLRLPLGGWWRAVRALREAIRAEGAALVYANSALPSQAAYFAARAEGVPLLVHLHAPYNRRYAWLYRFHRADMAVFVSRYILSLLAEKVRFAHPPRVIHNGVDTERFRPAEARDPALRAEFGIPPSACVFGQVGSLIHRKGIDIAIRAIAAPALAGAEVRLVLVGDGPDAPAFRALARSLGVEDRVIFAGQQSDPVPWYGHVFDVNLLVSRSDALGLAMLEGGACGLPALGTDVAGTPETMDPGVTGFLVPLEDHDALAALMARFAADPALRSSMGAAARAFAVERFSLDRQCREVEASIEEVLARTGRGTTA